MATVTLPLSAHTTQHDTEMALPTHEDHHDHDDATTIAETRSETVSLTDQTNLLPRKKVMAVFFGLALCILVSCLDSTIVATALPTISAAFDAGSVVSWVPSAYFLTSTAFQPLCESFPPLQSYESSQVPRGVEREIAYLVNAIYHF